MQKSGDESRPRVLIQIPFDSMAVSDGYALASRTKSYETAALPFESGRSFCFLSLPDAPDQIQLGQSVDDQGAAAEADRQIQHPAGMEQNQRAQHDSQNRAKL